MYIAQEILFIKHLIEIKKKLFLMRNKIAFVEKYTFSPSIKNSTNLLNHKNTPSSLVTLLRSVTKSVYFQFLGVIFLFYFKKIHCNKFILSDANNTQLFIYKLLKVFSTQIYTMVLLLLWNVPCVFMRVTVFF